MVETSGWLTNVPYKTAILYATIRLTYDVMFLRHVTSKKMKKKRKKCISSNRQGQTQGQGQIKVKGQGHLEIFTIVYVIDVIWLIYEKWN